MREIFERSQYAQFGMNVVGKPQRNLCHDNTSVIGGDNKVKNNDESRYALRIPRELFKELRLYAAMQEKSINAAIVEIIEEKLESCRFQLPNAQENH